MIVVTVFSGTRAAYHHRMTRLEHTNWLAGLRTNGFVVKNFSDGTTIATKLGFNEYHWQTFV